VDEDAAVLTCYVRERHRGGARFPGGELIDLYERRSAPASMLLRSIEGYGPGQPPSGGHPLPLSEDPPLAAIVVDTGPRIDAVLEEVTRLARPRFVSLERARLLSGQIDPLWLGESSTEATRLTIYCGHADSVYLVPAFEAACESLYRRGVAGATVLSGVDGTAGGLRHHAQFLRPGADAPLMVVAVGSGERIAMVLPELGGLFRHPVITVAKVRLCKRDGQFISRPETLPGTDAAAEPAGMAPRLKLTLYTSEAARHDGHPVHRVLVRRLRSAGISGATSQRGIWGFHGDHEPHGGHLRLRGRHVPVVTTVIDVPERIGAAFDVIDALTPGRGLVTAETVLVPEPARVRTDHES
jgi:PII-like signaling protein